MLRAFSAVPPTLIFGFGRGKGHEFCYRVVHPFSLLDRHAVGFSWRLFQPVNTAPKMGRGAGYWVRWGTPVCPGAETPLDKHSLLRERQLISKERRQEQTLKRPKLLLLYLPFYFFFFFFFSSGYPLQLSSLFSYLCLCESCPQLMAWHFSK